MTGLGLAMNFEITNKSTQNERNKVETFGGGLQSYIQYCNITCPQNI